MSSFTKNKCELLCCKGSEKHVFFYKELKQCLPELKLHGEKTSFQAKHVLFYEGHFASGCFLLEEGTIMLEKSQNSFLPSTNLLLPQKHRLIGLWHLLHEIPLCASAIAHTNIKAYFIPKAPVLSLFQTFEKTRMREPQKTA